MLDSEKKLFGEILGRMERMEIRGVSIDSRSIKEGELFVALKGDRFDGHDYVPEAIRKGAWGALVERAALDDKFPSLGGLRNILPVEDTLLALQEMAHLHRKKFSIPVVGITGSNGKTTTKEMIAGILKQKGPVLKNEGNLNNHIGVPLTLLRIEHRHRSAVVEMGMSAPGEIDLLARLASPDIGVITNIGPAHLEFLGSMDKVAEAKGELLDNLKPDGTAVLNADDRYFTTLNKKSGARMLTFGIDVQADVRASDIRQEKHYTDFTILTDGPRAKVRLRAVGKYNIYNALAAAAAAIAAGMSLDAVKYGLDDFVPVAMRSEVREVKGRTVLADYYNANPASMEAALTALLSLAAGRKAVAVLGDMLELGDAAAEAHREIGRIAGRLGVGVLIAMGELSNDILKGAREAGIPNDHLFAAGSHAEAADLLTRHSKNGDTVLIKGSRGMKMEKILEAF
ncbi:MAG TPA: UDP-N-acetylmuramoyl-tripeptide--D-alanyl-D-alanine ligase [Nitrospirota bacterium]